ncbi:LIPA.2 family protein [Megaselia abdita]
MFLPLIFAVFQLLSVATGINKPTLYFNAQDKIKADGYPVEIHQVTTEDGYILEMQRIPYSPKNMESGSRPAVLMQHGLLASSDNFVLADENQALAYKAADAGYDVWMGNNRGTFYSDKHVEYNIIDPRFWNFSITELAIYDLPASIDYILDYTNQEKIHYVGHSQGTTIYFMLLSERPEYNAKIMCGYMLAPIVFLRNIKISIALIAQIFGEPDPERFPFTSFAFLPRIKPINALLADLCAQPLLVPICKAVIGSYVGPIKVYTNNTLIPGLLANFPAGASYNQVVHFSQIVVSKEFRKFDWGSSTNLEMYGQKHPPNFDIQNIDAPTFFYYSNGDNLSSEKDVRFLMKSLNQKAVAGTKYYGDNNWNHFDYLAAEHLDIYLNLDILENMEKCKSL